MRSRPVYTVSVDAWPFNMLMGSKETQKREVSDDDEVTMLNRILLGCLRIHMVNTVPNVFRQ